MRAPRHLHILQAGGVAAARTQRPRERLGRRGGIGGRTDRHEGIEHLAGAVRVQEAAGRDELELGPVVAVQDGAAAGKAGGAGVPHHQVADVLLRPVHVQVFPTQCADARIREQALEPCAIVAERAP